MMKPKTQDYGIGAGYSNDEQFIDGFEVIKSDNVVPPPI